MASPAFQGPRRQLAKETRQFTLSLYRHLLAEANAFQQPIHRQFLRERIRERFRFHQKETSRKNIFKCLEEGVKTLDMMRTAKVNTVYMNRINDLAKARAGPLKHVVHNLRNIPDLERRAIAAADIRSRASRRRQPRRRYAIAASGVVCRLTKINTPTYRSKHFIKKITRKKPARFRNRKHYQVALTVKDSNGFEFKRVRGWRQPLKTSMMMKKRVRKVLLWQERAEDMEWYQEMIKYEREFQMSLGIKPDDYSEFRKQITNVWKRTASLRSRRFRTEVEPNDY
ncbi:hypothetical protein VTP01DRAFT_1176 [Rhizomucor pusillus]|uniref:uncharacterized protein n=1 Tax=Rhizomucor pusillus TaxID=4840 RepID=UPI0037443CC1